VILQNISNLVMPIINLDQMNNIANLKPIWICFCFLFFSNLSIAQKKEVEGKNLSKAQVLEEYDILYHALINYQAVPFMFKDKATLDNYVEDKKASFTSGMTEREFHLEVRKLIAQTKCGHTYAKPSIEWYQYVRKNYFLIPFNVFILGDEVFVKQVESEDLSIKPMDQILTINGMAIKDILKQMREIQERDGNSKTFIEYKIESTFRFYFLFLYGMPEEINIKFKSGEALQETTLALSKDVVFAKNAIELPPTFKVQAKNKWSTFATVQDRKLAYLKITTFTNRKQFKDYYKKVFQIIKDQKIERLILDLRNNTGGFFGNGNTLISYLSKEPYDFDFRRSKAKTEKSNYVKRTFLYKATKFAFQTKPKKNKLKDYKQYTFSYKPKKLFFAGKIDALINGGTFSQASIVAAQLNLLGATFYGEETGGTEHGTNALVVSKLTLPYSGIEVRIPYYQIYTYSSLAEPGRGILPDVALPVSKLDQEKDTQLEYLLKN